MEGKALLAAGCLTIVTATNVGGVTAQERMVEKAGVDQLELTVLLYSETDAAWLPAAQAIAGGLFEDAGIRLVWMPCSPTPEYPGCHRAPTPNEIAVRIVARRRDRVSPTCGVAVRPEQLMPSYITLFLDCLIEGSNEFRVKEPIIAGYCLAHEIAHLLLPVAVHTASGIMQSRLRPIDWQRASRGGLRFLPEERQQMADAVRRRLESTR